MRAAASSVSAVCYVQGLVLTDLALGVVEYLVYPPSPPADGGADVAVDVGPRVAVHQVQGLLLGGGGGREREQTEIRNHSPPPRSYEYLDVGVNDVESPEHVVPKGVLELERGGNDVVVHLLCGQFDQSRSALSRTGLGERGRGGGKQLIVSTRLHLPELGAHGPILVQPRRLHADVRVLLEERVDEELGVASTVKKKIRHL